MLSEEKSPELEEATKALFKSKKRKKVKPEEVYHTIQFVEDLPLQISAEIARTTMHLRDILAWQAGNVV